MCSPPKKKSQLDGELTKELDSSISKLKEEQEKRQMYLTYASRMMEYRQDGYDAGLTTGRKEGISVGLERGAYQTKLETAKALLAEGLSPDMVARCTNLPPETIQELMQEI